MRQKPSFPAQNRPSLAHRICAVLAGLLVFMILTLGADTLMRGGFPTVFGSQWSVHSHLLSAATIVYTVAFGVACSYLSALLARTRPMMHAMIFGGVLFAFTADGFVDGWPAAPVWFSLGYLIILLPAAWFGGLLRVRQVGA